MSIFCVGGGEFFRYAQNPPPPTQNIDTIAVTVRCNLPNVGAQEKKVFKLLKVAIYN